MSHSAKVSPLVTQATGGSSVEEERKKKFLILE